MSVVGMFLLRVPLLTGTYVCRSRKLVAVILRRALSFGAVRRARHCSRRMPFTRDGCASDTLICSSQVSSNEVALAWAKDPKSTRDKKIKVF